MYDNSMKKMIYQMFILGTDNLEQSLKSGLGGVIFFTKDIQSEEQVKNLINDIKLKSIIYPFLSIDQEGGRVERTEKLFPKRLSAKYAYEKGDIFLTKQSGEISKQLKELGFNLNFAPCVDVNTNILNPIIGERAFSNNPDDVIKGAEIFIKQSVKNGIIPCIKHFPGHGDSDKDSHLTLPQINLSREEVENVHIKPFKYFINAGVEMIMIAHLHCTCFDSKTIPASLSKNVIKYLRQNLGYDGVLISDDMIMKGLEQYGNLEAVLKGIAAGLNMFIFRDSKDETLDMIEKLVKIVEKDFSLQNKVFESYKKIISLKQKYGLIQ